MKAGTHIIILCIIFYCIPISAQKADSLVRLLRSDLHDTTRIKIYNDLFLEYEFSEAGMAKKYVNEALVLAKRTKYLEGMAVAWTHQGFYLEDLGNYSAAIKAFGKSKEIYLEIGKKQSAKDKWFGETGVANCLINMGNSNRGIADYPAALTCYRDAQKIFESQLNSGNEAVAQTARSRIASCTYNTGNIHFYQGNLGKAKECYLKSREFYEEAGDSSGIAGCYINLSAVFFSQAKYSESLDCVQKALEICLRINDIPNLENCYINLGNIYQQRNEFQKALDYEQKALDIDERIGNKSGMSATLGNISSNYLAMGKFVDAIESAQKSLDLAKETGALEWQLTAYVNLSVASDSIGKTKEAFDYYKMSVLIKDSIYNLEKHRQLAEVEAVFQTEKKQQEIEKQQLEIKRKNFQRNAFIAGFALILLLAVIILRSYVLKRKANQVLIAKNTEISQQKEEINAQADELLMKNEMLAQRNEEILSQSEKLKEINTELEKLSIVARETDNAVIITDPEGEIAWINEGFTRLYGYTLTGFIAEKGTRIAEASDNPHISDCISECAGKGKSVTYTAQSKTKNGRLLWIQTTLTPILNQEGETERLVAIDSDITRIKLAEEELAKKNMMITDSINYAKLIQQAILPALTVIREALPGAFVLFRPRDLVSGDFYWFHRSGNSAFFSAADCTGHGVPGAFMSMIGNTLLNEAVKGKKIDSPAQILHYMNLAVIEILNQQGLQTQDDGMDMTIARIETDSGKLNVATANQEALLFRNGACETVPAGNFSVGGFLSARKTAVYNDLQYSLCPEDSFYMFSDGLIDQFGGDGNEKFSLNRFREIISGMYTEPAGKQEAVLAGKLDAWMNPAPGVNIPQLDDILVIGISFRIQ